MTDTGAVVTRTSTDARVVAALQGHASEVSGLVQDGMAGMMRGMMAARGNVARGPRAGAGAAPAPRGPAAGEHAH
jgi:hypothetical protein